MTIIGLAIVIAFIVFSTAKLKWHPFLVLVLAAFLTAFFYGMPLPKIADTVGTGFGSILGSIGLVIVFGTIIGLVMERTGAAVVMAESVIKVLGERFPTLTMSVIGAIVSIPVFCDSGYVILNSLKETLAKRLKVSSIAMSVALATGLYATHNFVPPTPGPIAAAGNLGLADNLGLVIVMGLVVSVPACLAGWLWANRFVHEQPQGEGAAGQASTEGSVSAADREASSSADAVAAELAHDGKALLLGVGLDDVADVAQACTGPHLLDAQPQALPGDIHQTLGQHRRLADHEHAAGVAVEAILDDRDIDVEDVAVLELAVTGDAVADLVVDRRADRLGVGRMARRGVIERCRDRALHVGHVGVAETVQLLGGGARHHEGGDVVQKLGRQSAGNTHFLDFFRGLYSDGHGGEQGGIRTAC